MKTITASFSDVYSSKHDSSIQLRDLTLVHASPEASIKDINSYATKYRCVGHLLDVYDRQNGWKVGQIIALDVVNKKIRIHFHGRSSRYDTWVELAQVSAFGKQTGVELETVTSPVITITGAWNGKDSLFHTTTSDAGVASISVDKPSVVVVNSGIERKERKLTKPRRTSSKIRHGPIKVVLLTCRDCKEYFPKATAENECTATRTCRHCLLATRWEELRSMNRANKTRAPVPVSVVDERSRYLQKLSLFTVWGSIREKLYEQEGLLTLNQWVKQPMQQSTEGKQIQRQNVQKLRESAKLLSQGTATLDTQMPV